LNLLNLFSLILWQRLYKHDPRREPLVRRNLLGNEVDDRLLENVSVLAHDVGAGKLAGAVVGYADNGNVVDARVAADEILKLGGSDLKKQVQGDQSVSVVQSG
jgi:hypothetical protein